jgi:hypothetical protein
MLARDFLLRLFRLKVGIIDDRRVCNDGRGGVVVEIGDVEDVGEEDEGAEIMSSATTIGSSLLSSLLRFMKPLTHPENQKAWRGNMQASRPAGKKDPPVAYARLSGKRYDTQRRMWKTMRVVKKANANKVLERKLGYIDPSAKMKVGS